MSNMKEQDRSVDSILPNEKKATRWITLEDINSRYSTRTLERSTMSRDAVTNLFIINILIEVATFTVRHLIIASISVDIYFLTSKLYLGLQL